jgi:hypothetical protein
MLIRKTGISLVSCLFAGYILFFTSAFVMSQERQSLGEVELKNRDFEKNPSIPDSIKKEMQPYVIPDTHPMKRRLDAIFLKIRATQDERTFFNCGFTPISIRPCTHVYVASHSHLPGYLVKVYLDTELRQKMDKPSWKWLVKRCEGATAIRSVIKNKKLKHFIVANKWIYPLPAKPEPPQDQEHTRHLALLLVTDMDLVSAELNLHAWSHFITTEHLDELYAIISRAKGSSYRPDNISYTHAGQFAFIDTEYPAHGPDFKSIRPFLSLDMLAYWDQLVKMGGK